MLVGCGDAEIAPPRADRTDTSADVGDRAAALVRRLADALAAPDDLRSDDLAAPNAEARAAVATMGRNAAALRLTGVSLDLVDTLEPTPAQRERWPEADLVARVDAAWRLPEDSTSTSLETEIVLDAPGGVPRILGADSGERRALWLTDSVTVARGPEVVVVSAAGPAQDLLPLAQRAVVDVRRVLPRWQGPLVVERPADQAGLDALIGAEPGAYAGIAAVTTTSDGAPSGEGPPRVYLNPAVFDGLGDQGRQVVVSHEAVHVATAGGAPDMPAWLTEGFADYVALRYAGIGVEVAAGQALADVRADGPPERLPTAEDLSTTAEGLGATYESAWTAVRHLGELYGQARVVAFYDAVSGGMPVARAFQRVLGTTEAAFVRSWRADLVELAG